MSRPSEPADVRELFDDERAEQRRRRGECIDSLRAEATGRAPMTPERAAEREDETIEALIGLALLCIAWVALDALFRYLTTGG